MGYTQTDDIYNDTPDISDTAKEDLDLILPPPVDEGEGQGSSKSSSGSSQSGSSTEEIPDEADLPPGHFIHKGRVVRRKTNEEFIDQFKRPGELIKGVGEEFSRSEGGLKNIPNYIGAAGAGVIDFGIGLVNKIPKKNLEGIENPFHNEDGKIPSLPQYQNEQLQAVRDISSLIVPTLLLNKFFTGKAVAADKAIGWKLGKDKFVQWLGRTGIGVGTGILVDEIAPVQERDHNAAGWLKEAWPKTWGWVPDNFATLDGDNADVKRQKNRNEGAAFGFLSDLLVPIGRLVKGRQGIKQATSWVPKNEKAGNWLKNKNKSIKLSDDPVENDLLRSTKHRDDELSELGKAKINNGADLTQPQFGVHDMYDWTETGVRSSDKGGIVSAAVDQVKIVKQIDTRYGRIGSVLSPKTLYEVLTGKTNTFKYFNDLGKVLKETKVDYVGSKGQVVKHSDSLIEAEKLGAALYNTDLDGMKKLLRPISELDPQTGRRTLSRKAHKGVMQAIKKFSDDFANVDMSRSQGVVGTSMASQVSDMAEGARLTNGTPAVQRSYDQILDRLEFLMNLQGQTALTRQKTSTIGDILNRLKATGSELSPNAAAKSISDETNRTLASMEKIANGSKQTIETLRQVKAERPQMLAPLMLAYELTDGKVASIGSLNTYVRNTTGTISKAFFDARSDMPSAWTQGMWANIYNSVLSGLGTPLKAALSNTILMIERPIATFAGGLVTGDWATLRRAHYMYNVGMADTFQRSLAHMNQVFKRASVDPNSVGYIMRDDIARKNEGQLEFMRSFANAAEAEDNFGPSILTNQIETMNDLAEHPWLRFSANAMTGFDGFTRSFIGNIEARGRAYDAIMEGGGQLSEKRVRAMGRRVYGEMFDESGMITDRAVEYASREIAMNLDSPMVKALNEIVKTVPAVKPFMMFPKTSINMMRFAGSHNPVGLFTDQWNAFSLPFNQMNIDEVKKLLSERGVSASANPMTAYESIRAELKGRKAIGTALVSGGAFLFTQDRLRGNGIYDKTRQRARRELGWKPKTYKGLDGNWYSYENMGAITDWLALTADVMDNFDTLDEPSTELFLNRMGFLISANLTDKSFTAGLEPLGDVLSGNPAAAARWAGSFGSGLLPGSGFRNEFARLLTPQLKEVEQDFTEILANRNPGAKAQLPDLYDWMDGSKVGEPLGFFARVWNTYSPLWKVSEAPTPEKQFLIDIEFDGRPSLRTNGKGVEYTTAERSEVTRLMGESKQFANAVREIMNSPLGKTFRKDWKAAADGGVYFDRTKYKRLHLELKLHLRDAQDAAEAQLSNYDEIKQRQWINYETERSNQLGDVEAILRLQRN